VHIFPTLNTKEANNQQQELKKQNEMEVTATDILG